MKRLTYWLPPLILMAVIFFLSSRHKVTVSDTYIIQFAFFKTLHVLEYGILYILLYRAFRNSTKAPSWQVRYWAFLLSVLYGMSDELHQVFVTSREGTGRDVLIDTLGITIAFFIVWKLLPKLPPKLLQWARTLELTF